jgi:hypothetical protein
VRRSAAPLAGQLAFAADVLEAPPATPPASIPDLSAARAPIPPAEPTVTPTAPERPEWQRVLDFERTWVGGLAAKQRAVRESFGLSSARYHQVLDRALEHPEALAYDPALVGRLRRLRATRRRKRFAEAIGGTDQH